MHCSCSWHGIAIAATCLMRLDSGQGRWKSSFLLAVCAQVCCSFATYV